MKIKIIKSGPWQIGSNLVKFVERQTLVVGVDVPDKIAEDMLRCDYAIPAQQPKIETKDSVKAKKEEEEAEKLEKERIALENKEAEDLAAEQAEKEALEAKDEAGKEDADIESMDKDALEVYARENLSIELDKRKSIENLLVIVKAAIKEKNNE